MTKSLRKSILTTRDIADLLGWSTQRARRWLLRTGAASKRTGLHGRRGGRYVTTWARLRASFPEVVRALEREDFD